MLGQRQDAEDATQETFARVVRSLGQWDSSRRFEPWLLTVAGNRCRTKMAKRMSQAGTQVLEAEPAADESSSEGLILEEVQAGVAMLRPEYREVFTLFHFEHRSFEEIAETLQVPYATAKTWCHRARRELASILDRRGNLSKELGKI
jgi:RNA polymerase sigma-70 factor (ECF subfamily)